MLTTGERDHLVVLYERVEEAKLGFKEAMAAVAEKHGLLPATLRKYVTALSRDQAEEAREEAQQLLDLFEHEAEGLEDYFEATSTVVDFVPGKPAAPGRKKDYFEATVHGQKVSGWTQ